MEAEVEMVEMVEAEDVAVGAVVVAEAMEVR